MSEDLGVVVDGSFAVDDNDEVPLLVWSRYKLAAKVAHFFGCEAYVIQEESQDSSLENFSLVIEDEQKSLCIPFGVSTPKAFREGLQAVYVLLDQVNPKGKSLNSILVFDDVVAPVSSKDTSSPNKGGHEV